MYIYRSQCMIFGMYTENYFRAESFSFFHRGSVIFNFGYGPAASYTCVRIPVRNCRRKAHWNFYWAAAGELNYRPGSLTGDQ